MFGLSDAERKAKCLRLNKEGLAHLEKERYDEAVALFSRALAEYPSDAIVKANFGSALCSLKRYSEAIAMLDQALAEKPELKDARYKRALARREMGDYNGAVADFTVSLDVNPRHQSALLARAVAFERMGKFAEAAADFDAICDLKPAYEFGLFHAGACYRNLEAWQEALDRLDAAARISQQNHVFYWHRSYALEGLNRREEALADIERAIRLGPNDPEPPRRRLELLERMGRGSEAEYGRRMLREKRDRHVREVAERGKFVWAAVVQANEDMFREGTRDLPGTVAFTFDRNVPELGNFLATLAHNVFALKEQQLTDPEMMPLGNVTTREFSIKTRVAVPKRMTGGVEAYCQSVLFHRDFFPQGRLTSSFVPCAADVGGSGEIVHLPWSMGQKRAGELRLKPPRDAGGNLPPEMPPIQ